ncbi:Vacuolar ATP synthase catalytic-related / V-ATPase-related [Salix suchowensis]|nr:Vacuolar ATP synthase catalytic-related / V-ATPase-related [Salix suchowensis]
MDSPPRKINLISCGPMAHVSDIKLIRTDTTLDLSQKAEKASVLTPTFTSYDVGYQKDSSSPLPAAHQDARTVFSDQKQEAKSHGVVVKNQGEALGNLYKTKFSRDYCIDTRPD